jgi:hypothetical protein
VDEINAPIIYVVNRQLPKEETLAVLHTLRITPCCCSVISNILDAAWAEQLTTGVLRADDEMKAIELAKGIALEYRRPVMVLGEADFIDAIWPDGSRSPIAKSC